MRDAASAQSSVEGFRDRVEQVPAVLYEAEPGRDRPRDHSLEGD